MEEEFRANKGFINIETEAGNIVYKINATEEVWKLLAEVRLKDKFKINGIDGILAIKTILFSPFQNRITFNCRIDNDVPFL